MIYEYKCIECKRSFDVTKSVKDIDVNEFCPRCDSPAERKFVPSKLHLTGTKVEHAEYNPGLGAVVKSKYERQELAKRKGLVEVGNDYKSGESMQKSFDETRAKKLATRYEED